MFRFLENHKGTVSCSLDRNSALAPDDRARSLSHNHGAGQFTCQLCRIRHSWHAQQHIFDVAKTLYGPGSDLAAQWRKIRRD